MCQDCRDRRGTHSRPTEPHDEIAWIELPWFGGMAEADRTGSQKHCATRQDDTGAEALDHPADPRQQPRPDDEGDSRRTADGPGGPPVHPL